MNELIYSISKLFSDFIGDGVFIIPAYQRGYKWNKSTVEQLLKDIEAFNIQKDSDKFYCLQNITLVERVGSNREYNVVDGQQRLTTIAVLLSCIGEDNLVNGKIRYDVRPQTESFIGSYMLSKEGREILKTAAGKWDDFLKSHESEDLDYQDIYYLFTAFGCVWKWFASKTESEQNALRRKILNNVKLIVNNVESSDEQKLFGNLNGGKVQLDGSDLVRAMIITDVAMARFEEVEASVKSTVQLNESRVRIGIQIDSMMRWWKNPLHASYFKPITKQVKTNSDIQFDENAYPINGLYKLYSLICGGDRKTIGLDLFEKDIIGHWDRIQYLQRVLESWIEDREIYHLLLYVLLYYKGDSNNSKDDITDRFVELFSEWQNNTRIEFCKILRKKCNSILTALKPICTSKEAKEDYQTYLAICKDEDWYIDNDIIKLMIALDIIDIVNSKTAGFLPIEFFSAHKEDKEHIFPQTPIGDKIDKKKEVDRTAILNNYIDLVNKHRSDNKLPIFELAPDEPRWDDEEWLQSFKDRINNAVLEAVPINSLGNVCLLSDNVNRGYGNEFYTEKRIAIISKSRGGVYIRPHVLDAFDKEWLQTDVTNAHLDEMTSWTVKDIISRRMKIEEKIVGFYGELKKDEQ